MSRLNMTLVFSHIPKTAGTSLRATLSNQFRTSKVLLDYGPDSSFTSDVVKQYIYEKKDFYRFKCYLKNKKIKLIAGHFDSYKYAPLVGAQNVISMIRKPSDRVISEYYHLKKMSNYNRSPVEFVKSTNAINKQVKWLGHIKLPLIGFVGITEEYSKSLNLINRIHSLKLKEFQLNQSERKPDIKNIFSMSEELQIDLYSLNKLDIKYYELVKLWLNNIDNQISTSSNLVRGWVDFDKNANAYVGATWLDSAIHERFLSVEDPVPVEIYLDDVYCKTIVASQYNKYVAQYHNVRAGYVGFKINIDTLPKFKRIRIQNGINGALLLNEDKLTT